MNCLQTILALTLVYFMTGCIRVKVEEKGFQVSADSDNAHNERTDGLNRDSLTFDTRPGSVLLTGLSNVRLTPVYKVNMNRRAHSTFIGSNYFHYRYEEAESDPENNWHNHLIPGMSAIYGYNLVNVSHYDVQENRQKNFFEKPVLIKTLYFPACTRDTLNNRPVQRTFFFVSVYSDDTNKDGFINLKDLRRLYLFDLHGEKRKALVPENYSVFQSEYDPDNDFMYVFAQLDSNGNGQRDDHEPIHIFWIDMKDPNNTGRQY